MSEGTPIVVLADFTADVLCGYLRNDPGAPPLAPVSAGFGQVLSTLLNPAADCWRGDPPYALIWTRPEAVIASYARLVEGEAVALETVLGEVKEFARAVNSAASARKRLFVVAWAARPSGIGGSLDMRPGVGPAGTLMAMNVALAEALDPGGTSLLNPQPWIEAARGEAFSPKRWFLGKIPFGNPVFKGAARHLKAAIDGVEGRARKLLILDLDDTLWGGVVGDVGWEGLRLGGHDAVGEAFVELQRSLRALKRRGVLLGIVSKNTESLALEAIDHHPEMVLRREDFAGWRINWDDKARNVADLVASLNLGLDAAVFIDDSTFERARLRETLPQVLVPDWPDDPLAYPAALSALLCFDVPFLTGEDAARSSMYAVERTRQETRASFTDANEWLKTLGLSVAWEPLTDANLTRVAQLLNKTNQMNLRTRRLSEAELARWAAEPRHRVCAFHVADRFGSAGLTGILGLRIDGEAAEMEDFVLSCRVMGRRIEEAMVHVACTLARAAGAKTLRAHHLPTAKNGPCLAFWQRSGLKPGAHPGEFVWDLADDYPAPDAMTVTAARPGGNVADP